MKIYTKTGDDGRTGLFGGPRVWKDDARIEAYGTVDELNSTLGAARCHELPDGVDRLLSIIQSQLFSLGAELATPEPEAHGTNFIGEDHIAALETAIDDAEKDLPPLKHFILPAGHPAAAALQVARSVCRRAERRVIALGRNEGEHVSPTTTVYLNRLSDLLFVLARRANHVHGIGDVEWEKG